MRIHERRLNRPLGGPLKRDEALLEDLRELLRAPALEWAEPPRPLGEGAESIVLALTLRNADDWSDVPLVVRLLQTDAPDQLAREAAVQAALAEAGFPAPRPVAHGPGRPGLLEPFLVMERIRGRVMFALLPALVVVWIALGVVGLGALGWALGAGWILLAVLLQRRLHALPVNEIERAIAARGIDPAEFGIAAWLARTGEQVERLQLDELDPGLTWLRSQMPRERAAVVCHGDYWPGNMMVSLRGVTGLIDWGNAAIAPREFDVGWNRVQDAGDMPAAVGLSEPWRGRLGALFQPLAWVALLPHRWLYRAFHRLDTEALDYFTALHCLRILVWSYERERATDGAANPWSSARARALVASRFQRITGIELAVPGTPE